MKLNLKERLANFDLSASRYLHPLYEAIVNSIFAVEEKYHDRTDQGSIKVTILKSEEQLPLSVRLYASGKLIKGDDILHG